MKTFATAAELQKLYKPNDWNQYRIIARGHKITLFVNGVLMSRDDRPSERPGGRSTG